MYQIEWLEPVYELYAELPTKDRIEIQKRLTLLERFPDLYPLRHTGHFRGLRYFVAGRWIVYYRHVGDTIFVRALWPARIPYS